jgi:putative OPT family oligopeptide transporter
VVLSVVLAAVLAAANAYLGLFAGMTVSASIPAAVVSMAVLRLFRRSNILENNIVQTAASSGEAVAAGMIFTIPALILIGYWSAFDYWQVTAIAMVGGLLGVLCTIPLRRALIVEAGLRFPEGVATAQVLKVGSMTDAGREASAKIGLRTLLTAAGLGGAIKLGESGLGLWTEAAEGAAYLGRSVFYLGMNLSPALLAVGFIIGLETAVVVFLGGALGWLVLMPAYSAVLPSVTGADPVMAAKAVWSGHIRYVGIGAMLVGGIWTLSQLRGPVSVSLRQFLRASTAAGKSEDLVPRTERDASLWWILILFVTSLIPMGLIYRDVVDSGGVAVVMTLLMAAAAFLFSSVAAYMAGLVGSSSNPVSGVTIATLMLAALLLVLLMGRGSTTGPAAALVIAAVVCCAAAMGGDNLQDLKTGHLVGSTPWKQQIMQVVGVATGAVVLVPILSLLQEKYGIGDVTPEHPHPLSAPQATLMANLAKGIFGDDLPWSLVGLGVGIAVGIILLDRRQASRGSTLRLPVLAVALGIYLPLKLSVAILAGGLIAEGARRAMLASDAADPSRGGRQDGLLFAAGVITGEALTGILVALPIALSAVWPVIPTDPFRIFEVPPWGPWPGIAAVLLAGILLCRAGARRK